MSILESEARKNQRKNCNRNIFTRKSINFPGEYLMMFFLPENFRESKRSCDMIGGMKLDLYINSEER